MINIAIKTLDIMKLSKLNTPSERVLAQSIEFLDEIEHIYDEKCHRKRF